MELSIPLLLLYLSNYKERREMYNSLEGVRYRKGPRKGLGLSDLQKATLLVGIELRYCECTSQLIKWLEAEGNICDAITLRRIYTAAKIHARRKGEITKRLIKEAKRRLGDV